MDPAPDQVLGPRKSRSSFDEITGSVSRKSWSRRTDQDLSVMNPEDVRKSNQNLDKCGSGGSSLSALDMIANGLPLDAIPYYDLFIRNLSYKVNVKSKGNVITQRILLNKVSAEAFHGQILAVVGPSGSGKTTFLDALAGRVSRKSLEGEVYVNGDAIDDSFNRISGYVMQDDDLFPMLTVRETLLFSARLRISDTMPIQEKKKRVENMINQLGLKGCADTRVGNDKVRGVSGGERRRVSIGADLIHDPPVLFLDEPTSGLDSTSALSVMQVIALMAKMGKRTVVLTIHQPSYRILDVIQRVLVLGHGNVIYHGFHSGLKHHFDSLNQTMPEFVNVIEYALDTVEKYQKSPEGLQPLISLQMTNKTTEDLEDQKTVLTPKDTTVSDLPPKYATSFLSECFVLFDRNAKNILRTPELFYSRVGMMVTVALTLGTLFLRVKLNEKGIKERTSFISFTLALLLFTTVESLGVFLQERQIFIREKSRGAYRASTYVIAGSLIMWPFLLLLAFVYSLVAYFLVGLVAGVGPFLFFTVVTFLTLSMANSFVSFISGLVPNITIGHSICSAVIAYFFLFSGFFIERHSIPGYWIWLHYLSLFKYPFEAMLENEFGNLKGVIWYGNVDSDAVLDSISSGRASPVECIVAMVVFTIGYRLLFWIILEQFTKSVRQ